MLTIISHLDIRMAEKRVRDGGQRISYRSIERMTGVTHTTSSGMASGQLTQFPEDALVALCEYLECTLCGPDGLIELVDVPATRLSAPRAAARRRREERHQRSQGRGDEQG